MFATWTSGDKADKTITGCIVGKPIIFGVKMKAGGKWNNFIKVKSGANMITTTDSGMFFALGNETSAPASLVVVPTATTVVVTIIIDSSEFYCYK